MIHCQVSHSLFLDPIFTSYVYASCFMLVKEDLWVVLVAFADSNDSSWIVGGDFNVVRSIFEISVGHAQP